GCDFMAHLYSFACRPARQRLAMRPWTPGMPSIRNVNPMDHCERSDASAITGSRAAASEHMASPVGVVAECDIAEGIPAIPSPRASARALLLVRMFGEPLGMLTERLPADGMNSRDLA